MNAAPNTNFDWGMYSNATFAGLSVLTPIPLVDWALEEFFRRRMPAAIARSRGLRLNPAVLTVLNRGSEDCLTTCLTLPLKAAYILLKSLSRKLFYFLSVKEASDKVSFYWHQAFLMDYMLASGHLENYASAELARQAMDLVIRGAPTSPLTRLAAQMIDGFRHGARRLFRTLLRARKGTEDEEVQRQKVKLIQGWGEYGEYLRRLAHAYDLAYQRLLEAPPAVQDSLG